jgi:hypothetical protein
MRFDPRGLLSIGMLCVGLGLSSSAAATTFELGGGVGADFNAGADTLLVLEFDDGDSQDIKAGNGLSLFVAGGAIFFDHQPHQLETVLALGVKFSTMQPTTNADLTFTRFPIEALAFYRNPDWFLRVGGGVTKHLANTLSGTGDLSDLDADLDSSLGGIVQADFILGGWFVGMRYTALSYTVDGGDESLSASSLGVTLGYMHHFMHE